LANELARHQDRAVRADDQMLRRLLEAAGEGDDVALGEFVRATQSAVWRVCSALGTVGEEADLVQDTYARALVAIGRFRGDSSVIVWLTTIARNVCADDVRRRQRRRRAQQRLSTVAHDSVVAAPEFFGDLTEALDPDRREAFVLTQLLGYSYDDAAEMLGCPVGTVRSRVSRARADLAAMLERRTG